MKRGITPFLGLSILMFILILVYMFNTTTEAFQASKPYKVAVISANYGGYDTVKEHPIKYADKVDWFYFTDKKDMTSKQWKVINHPYHLDAVNIDCNEGINAIGKVIDPRTRNMMAAKYYKAKMHDIDILKGYDYYIWIDGSIILRNSFLEELFSLFDKGYTLISFKHSKRTNVSDEIIESRKLPKYDTQDLEGQFNAYKKEGFQDDVGLYENTIMIRKNTPRNKKVFDEWWCNNVRYSYQDQISLPFCFWKLKVKPDYVINENVFNNKRFSYVDYNQMKKH